MNIARSIALIICAGAALGVEAACDNVMYNANIRKVMMTYQCDVEGIGSLSCLSSDGGDGFAHQEIYTRLTDDIMGLVSTDYQIGSGGQLTSSAFGNPQPGTVTQAIHTCT